METIFVFTLITILAPLLGALLTPLWQLLGAKVRDLAGFIFVAFAAISAIVVFVLYKTPISYDINWTGNEQFVSGFYLDQLSVLMALIVSVLSMLIAFFSLEYMGEDKHRTRYWFFLQFFVSGMLLLVLSQDLIFLFLGWEIVGICSCFLIGHHFMKKGEEGRKPALSGIKALITTGIGDVGLLIFLAWAFLVSNTIIIDDLTLGNANILTSIILILAPVTKSAQFPLQSWLSSGDTVDIDAMQGPTTVSALIHAATMVKAGVYLVARFLPIYTHEFFYTLLMVLAGITVVIAAFGALVTTDLKRVLAYSTVSQLSYMFLALSMGTKGLFAGEMHLFSHAIFKALLFLSAGAIIHSIADERDITKMGGLRKELPVIYAFMLVGVLSLIGVPILTNGGYSKELIIGTAYIEGYWFIFAVTVLTAFLTALYSTRMFLMMFHGENRGVHVHKPKYIMQSTLAILAFLAVATGFIIEGPLHNFMYGVDDGYALIRHFYAVPFFSAVGAVVVGVGLGYLLYGKGQTEVAFITNTKVLLALRTFVAEGFYMDHLYNLIVIKPVFFVGEKLSFLHTGKINWNLMLSTLVTIVTIVLLMVVF